MRADSSVSKALAAPGVRTSSGPSWRRGVSAALGYVIAHPSLWLCGALGFFARGGLVVLALPIITIPSPVILSILLEGQFDVTGLAITSEVASSAAAVSLALALLGVLLAAYADAAAFQGLVADPQTEVRGSGRRSSLVDGVRAGTIVTLAAIQAIALLPIVAAVVLLAGPVYEAVVREQALPSSATPLAIRALLGARDQLALLLLALVVADVVYATSSRAVLAWHAGIAPDDGRAGAAAVALRGALRPLSRPGPTIATSFISWSVTLLVLAPVVWAVVVAWQGVRNALLSVSALTDPQLLPGTLAAILIFAAIWVAGVVLAGFASAVRAALWSVDAIR